MPLCERYHAESDYAQDEVECDERPAQVGPVGEEAHYDRDEAREYSGGDELITVIRLSPSLSSTD